MTPKDFYLTKRRQSGGHYYLGFRQQDGKVKWVSTGKKTKSEALAAVNQFTPGTQQKIEHITLSRLSEIVKGRANGSLSVGTVSGYQNALTNLKNVIGDIYITDVTVEHIHSFLDKRRLTLDDQVAILHPEDKRYKRDKSHVSDVTLNVDLRGIKACFNRALDWGLLEKNPGDKVKLMKIPKTPPLFFSKEDFKKFITKVTDPLLNDVFTFAVYTGLRLSEITNLVWEYVDFQNRQFTVTATEHFTTKTNKSRTVPMAEPVYEILKRWEMKRMNTAISIEDRNKATGFVFHRNGYRLLYSFLSHSFKRHVRATKEINQKLHFHSCRHTFASWALQAGVPVFTVTQWCGWGSSKMLDEIYGHLHSEHSQEQIKKLSV